MSRDNNLEKGLLIGFFTGGIIGASIALLFAPKSGKELRTEIKTKADELGQEAEKIFNEVKTKTTGTIASTLDSVKNESTKIKTAVKAGVDAFKEGKDNNQD